MQRNLETRCEAHGFLIGHAHTTAPPEKLKNDRKNEDAAKAMESPNTIWISLRAPPLESPKASARPVAIMMITATMRATGPWMESRMDCSGPSQGIEEPAACAVLVSKSINTASNSPCPAGLTSGRSRASRDSGWSKKRKATVWIMAVLLLGWQVGWNQMVTARRVTPHPARPSGGSRSGRSPPHGQCPRCGVCGHAQRCESRH